MTEVLAPLAVTGVKPQQFPVLPQANSDLHKPPVRSSVKFDAKKSPLDTSFVVLSQRLSSRDGNREGVKDEEPDLQDKIAFQHQMRHDASRQGRNPKRDHDIVPSELKGLTLAEIEKRLRHRMVKRYGDLKRAFVAFDRKGTGLIKIDDLKRVLNNFVLPMNDFIFERIMDRCGIQASHDISYEQFLDKFQPVRLDGLGHSLPIKPRHIVNPIRGGENEVVDVKELWANLKKFVESNHSSLKETFLKFDDNRAGFVNHKKFRQVLSHFHLRLTDADFKKLMTMIDPQKTNKISYQEFLNVFECRENIDAHPWLDRKYIPQKMKIIGLDQNTIETVLRHKLQDNWKSIYQAFLDIDTNQDGYIEKQELGNLLNSYAIPLQANQMETLWSKCDVHKKGKVAFLDFMKYMGLDILSADKEGPSTRIHEQSDFHNKEQHQDQDTRFDYQENHRKMMTSKRALSDVVVLLRDKINEKAPDLRKLFVKYDFDGDGRISKREFQKLLSNFGMEMDEHQFRALTKEMNFHKGYLQYIDFLYFFQETRLIGHGEHLMHVPNHRVNQIKEQTESMSPEDALRLICKKMELSSQTIREAFVRLDWDHDGLITRGEFRRIIDQFMIPLSKQNFDAVMRYLGIPPGRMINFNLFVDIFERTDDLKTGHPWLFGEQVTAKPLPEKKFTLEEALNTLRKKTGDQWQDAKMAFAGFDRDGNMKVTKKELASVLFGFNIFVSADVFKQLWEVFDTTGRGSFGYHEFLAVIGDELGSGDAGVSQTLISECCGANQEHHKAQLDKHDEATKCQISRREDLDYLAVETILRDKFRDRYKDMRKAFLELDRNRDGFVTKEELQTVLHDFHLFMTDVEYNKLLHKVGLGNKRKISYTQFLRAFEDPRLCGDMRTTLDVPTVPQEVVSFDTADTMTEEEAITFLRAKVADNAETIHQAFNAFDKCGEGRVTREDLRQIIDAFCLQLSNAQFNYLLRQLDVAEDGTVSYNKFMESFQRSDDEERVKWLDEMDAKARSKTSGCVKLEKDDTPRKISPRRLAPLETITPRDVGISFPGVDSPPTTSADVERRIGSKVLQKWQDLNKGFKGCDTNQSGHISIDDFKGVLSSCDIHLTDVDMSTLQRKYDVVRQGRMPYVDFMKRLVLQPRTIISVNSNPSENIKKKIPADEKFAVLVAQVKPDIVFQWKTLRRAFKDLDDKEKGDGCCSYAQFKDTLQNFQIDLLDNEYQMLAEAFDFKKNSQVNYNEFIRHTLAS